MNVFYLKGQPFGAIRQNWLLTLFFSYWINGNDNGMWYISVALFLYAIAPLLIAFKSGKYVGWGGIFSALNSNSFHYDEYYRSSIF